MSIEEETARRLKEKLSLQVDVRRFVQSGQHWLVLQPLGLLPGHGFALQMRLNSKNLEAEFVTTAGSGNLPHRMSQTGPSARQTFAERASRCRSAGAVLHLEVDGKWTDDSDCSGWPPSWFNFVLRVEVSGKGLNEQETSEWAERLLSLVLALIPPSAAIEPNAEVMGLPEGALSRVEVNRYERSPINRANCIAAHGDACLACGLSFGDKYGDVGAGFIHVHHVVPVSQLGSDYVVDPIADLVPLCPNCHAMAHRRDPPFFVDELKAILGNAKAEAENAPAA